MPIDIGYAYLYPFTELPRNSPKSYIEPTQKSKHLHQNIGPKQLSFEKLTNSQPWT